MTVLLESKRFLKVQTLSKILESLGGYFTGVFTRV